MVAQTVPLRSPVPRSDPLGRVGDEESGGPVPAGLVFCLSSSYEGFGIPYAEAMASGLPVVATRNVGARYLTDRGRAGVLVDPPDLRPTLSGCFAVGMLAANWRFAGCSVRRCSSCAASRIGMSGSTVGQLARRQRGSRSDRDCPDGAPQAGIPRQESRGQK